jgi:hypothetical protein
MIYNFDFAPGKNFVQKKSHRRQRDKPKTRQPRQQRHIPSLLEFTLQRVRHPHKLKLELQLRYRS